MDERSKRRRLSASMGELYANKRALCMTEIHDALQWLYLRIGP